jgi:hypothetical protein
MFEARYLLVSLPAVSLVVAWLIVGLAAPGGPGVSAAWGRLRLSRRRPLGPNAGRRISLGLRTLAGVLLVGLLTLRALQLAPAYGVSTEPWRTLTREVLTASRPGDCIAFYPSDTRMPFRYYLPAGAAAPRPILPAVPWGGIRPFVEAYSTLSPQTLTRDARRCGRVWLVSGHEGHNDGTTLGRVHFQRYTDLVDGLGQRYQDSTLQTFGAAHILTLQLFSDPGRKRGASAF